MKFLAKVTPGTQMVKNLIVGLVDESKVLHVFGQPLFVEVDSEWEFQALRQLLWGHDRRINVSKAGE